MRQIGLIFVCLFLLVGCSKKKAQLNLFVWSDYFSPKVIETFEKEFNCRIVVDTFETNEAMYAKLKLGASGYDIVMPSNYIFDTMYEQGMLHQLDYSKMTNMRFFRRYKMEELGLTENPYGLPFVISYTGLGYRKSRFEDFKASWTIFGQKDLRGRMTMLNDMREALGAALITLGYSINTRNPKELDQAVALLLKWKKNLAKFESEQFKNGLASAEYLVVQGFNSDILQVMEEEDDVGFAFPKEGAIFSIDYLAIPKQARNMELAQEFINFLLRPNIASMNLNHTFTATLVEYDPSLVKPILKDSSILYPSPEIQRKSQLVKNVGDALDLYSEAWEKVLGN